MCIKVRWCHNSIVKLRFLGKLLLKINPILIYYRKIEKRVKKCTWQQVILSIREENFTGGNTSLKFDADYQVWHLGYSLGLAHTLLALAYYLIEKKKEN